jgi:2-polyprenyl-3-methyl-5-hydroxy-6-metoxy-1,4-benzoquinol methylase
MVEELPEHVRRNRKAWDASAADYVEMGRHGWQGEPSWGIWSVPDSELQVLPADLSGLDAIELGCGTAYVSAWLARRGARVVGIDNSEQQLDSARAFQREFGLDFPLWHARHARVGPAMALRRDLDGA